LQHKANNNLLLNLHNHNREPVAFNHNPVEAFDVVNKDTRNGRFYKTPSGLWYPSITTVLGDVEKPAIQQWRMSLGDAKAKKEMERAAARGSAVHEITEKFLNNDPSPTDGYESTHVRQFNTLKPHLRKINNILCQEIPLFSDELEIAGRVDCIGEYDGRLAVIDFKTSNNNKRPDMIHDYFMQASAYAIMFQEMYNVQIDDIVIIMAVEKGIVPLVFRETVEPWIEPLCERINNYYTKHPEKKNVH
jgi:CRISPR/Cas system-associated exonuclease Cas4 (RecB family)